MCIKMIYNIITLFKNVFQYQRTKLNNTKPQFCTKWSYLVLQNKFLYAQQVETTNVHSLHFLFAAVCDFSTSFGGVVQHVDTFKYCNMIVTVGLANTYLIFP